MPQATDTATTPDPKGDGLHRILCGLAELADAARGMADMLETAIPDNGGPTLRALVRLAGALAEDADRAHKDMDELLAPTKAPAA